MTCLPPTAYPPARLPPPSVSCCAAVSPLHPSSSQLNFCLNDFRRRKFASDVVENRRRSCCEIKSFVCVCDWPRGLMRNRCVPFNLNKSNLRTRWPGRTPGPQLASTSGTAASRLRPAGLHGALLMSFYCASGVLITAIFNLIYARQLLSRHDVGAEY